MARGKVHLKRIQNPANRRVTFSKRKGGLLKKAQEISVLCEAEIGLIIFSPTGKLFEFASPSMTKIMGKYQKLGVSLGHDKLSSEYLEILGLEVENLEKRLRHLENMYKHMNGQDLDLLNFKNLKCIEKKMSLGARKIQSKKDKISLEYIRSLKVKGKSLKLENAQLDKKEKSLELENAVLNKKIGRSHKACHLNIDIMEEVNDKLKTDAATQQDLPQTNLSLT